MALLSAMECSYEELAASGVADQNLAGSIKKKSLVCLNALHIHICDTDKQIDIQYKHHRHNHNNCSKFDHRTWAQVRSKKHDTTKSTSIFDKLEDVIHESLLPQLPPKSLILFSMVSKKGCYAVEE